MISLLVDFCVHGKKFDDDTMIFDFSGRGAFFKNNIFSRTNRSPPRLQWVDKLLDVSQKISGVFQQNAIKCPRLVPYSGFNDLPNEFPTMLNVAIALAFTMLGPGLQAPFSIEIIKYKVYFPCVCHICQRNHFFILKSFSLQPLII